jgi:hypothetical protein
MSRLGVFAVVAGALGVSAGCYGQGGTDPSAIDLPPPEHGVQLQTPAFEVPPGTEVQHCYYFKLPSDVDLDVTRIQIKYLDGSHHMNLFQTDQDINDHDEDCFGPVAFSSPTNPHGFDLIVGSQSHDLDWKMPDGIAFKLKAHRQLLLQTHYVNAKTQATPLGIGHVKVNLSTSGPDDPPITAHMGTMFANNVNIHIPPHDSRSFSTTCDMPVDPSKPAQTYKFVAMTGHFHSRGRTFSVNMCPDGKTPTDEVFRSKQWSEPPFTILDQPRDVPSGGGLYYTCDFQNDTDLDITFGPHVEYQEHCNLFAYFYPWEEDHTRYCF